MDIGIDISMDETPPPDAITQCSRRAHKKTRTGCKVCKARKIKCDEAKPHCNNCLKHSVHCEYLSQPLPLLANNPATNGQIRNSPESRLNDPHPNLDLIDMQILHHYTTSTYHTLRTDPVQRTIWQTTVCELGFSYEFVLRGVLAIAALHLAYLWPSRKDFYITRGKAHYQLGLQMATGLLLYINEDNCHPLCIFAGLAGMFAMASPREPQDFLLVNNKGLADWMVLIRGMSSIIELSQPTLFSGSLGLIFQNGSLRFQVRSSEPFILGSVHDNEVLTLQERLFNSTTSPDPVRSSAYMEALSELRKSLNILYGHSETHEASDAFIWVFEIPETYLILLTNQDQGALCIFAFFCILLHRLSECWWAQGWSTHLMGQVYRVLDDEHRGWVQWPIQELGGMGALQNLP